MTTEQCNIPPKGWRCIREPGHDGPCAAMPVSDRDGLPEITMQDFQAVQAIIAQLWANKQAETPEPPRRESIMRKAGIRADLIYAAVAWYRAGCPGAQEDGEGPQGKLEDAIHALLDHEQQVEERAEARKLRATS